MEVLKIPGFTAEQALYRTRGSYRTGGPSRVASSSGGVVPALPLLFCLSNCDQADDPFACRDSCFLSNSLGGGGGAGGGGGGGGPGSGDGGIGPTCLACLANCNKKPLLQRAQCRRNCHNSVC